MPRVVHFEIHAENPDRAIAFYSGLLGWQFQSWDGPMPYWLILTGPDSERGINGGLVRRMSPNPIEDLPVTGFVCTVEVPELESLLARAITLGGAIAMPRTPIPGVGWLGYVKDTEGNVLGLMQPDSNAR